MADTVSHTTKWFISQNNSVRGPFSTSELQDQIQNMDDASSQFVWSRGQSEWTKADRWSPDIDPTANFIPPSNTSPGAAFLTKEKNTGLSGLELNTKTAIAPDENTNVTSTKTRMPTAPTPAPKIGKSSQPPPPENTVVNELIKDVEDRTVEKFRVQLNFVEQNQMTKEELMTFAARQDDVSKIAVFDNKTKDWKEIYAFPEIVAKLGISRRKHPRVPILAQFSGKTTHHEQLNARVITVSEGGLGLTDVHDLNVGDTIDGLITSPHFFAGIQIKAEVTYSGTDSYVGLRFTQISDEGAALIMDYIRRFGKENETP